MRYIKQAMLAAALAGAVLLSGCALMQEEGAAAPGATVTPEATSVPEATPAPEATPVPEVTPAPEATQPPAAEMTTNQVIAAYEEYAAFESYWYKGGNAAAVQSETATVDGQELHRYDGEGIGTLQQLTEKALSLMTQEAFDSLQARIPYADVDGALYGPPNYGSSGESGFVKNESEAARVSEGEFLLKVGHYYTASLFIDNAAEGETLLRAETTAVYSKTENGWRFSKVEYQPVNTIAG